MDGAPAKTRQILERIAEAIHTAKDVRAYVKEHPEFAEIGRRMLEEWDGGIATSLLASKVAAHFREKMELKYNEAIQTAEHRIQVRAPERWLSGRKQRFAKPISRLKQVQENKP